FFKFATVAVGIVAFIFSSFLVFPLPRDRIERGYSKVIKAGDGTTLRVFLSKKETYRFYTPLEKISSYVIKGFIEYEDKYFYYHPGINPVAVVKAALLNLKQKRIISGASTITMQIARMLHPKSRTIFHKIIEMLRAFQLEILYSKKELLEIYLNLVPMGGNIEGVSAASWIYFQKDIMQLSPAEAAVLIAIPKSPSANRPDIDPERTNKVKNGILDYFFKKGIIDEDLYRESLKSLFFIKREKYPFLLPHLTTRISLQEKELFNMTLTVDMKMQKKCEDIVLSYLSRIKRQGIYNLSLLVVDNHTMKALVYIGSPDFFDRMHHGQVDGIISRRSPGSTLKPFIYAKAFDKGLVTPLTILYDVPKVFKGYTPKNYDKSFSGMVTVKKALVHSLNVPAVDTLEKLNEFSMKTFLEDIGVWEVNPGKKDLGLSIALGAQIVSLENLVSMYAGLANQGVCKRIIYIDDKKTYAVKRIVSKEAAYMITEILSSLTRPDIPASWEYTQSLPKVAYKTGTSFGLNDAWSIAYNPDYTVGVWVGNFSGKDSPALVGIQTATPLLFNIFNEIARGSDSWFEKPDNVKIRKVCMLSGKVPGEHCKQLVEDQYIPGVSTENACDIHKIVEVDGKTGYVVCDHCRKDKLIRKRVILNYPAEYVAWSIKQGLKIDRAPSHDPDCSSFDSTVKLKIKFPIHNKTYFFREDAGEEDQAVLFQAETFSDAEKIFWIVNKKIYRESKPGKKVFFKSAPGTYKLTCIDDCGRSDEIEFKIRYR
ncbi:MAG: penicillin-binding protein 1C, partial [Spirochaetes bacterium]|nr:penicillin-binding protein 1C [Spirochaetota bacterium]